MSGKAKNEEECRWHRLAVALRISSRRICHDNGCAEDNHNCESYAYISEDGELHDICLSDYWQGWGDHDRKAHGRIAPIPLPFVGTGKELKEMVENENYQ